MSELVIETTGLRKEFRSRRGRRIVAVEDLDLAVVAGGVHGFLGPNGSGKTTTIRMLLGLARPTSGQIRLFGEPMPQRLPRVINRVGAVVEQPKFVPNFSGRKNLSLLASAVGLPAKRVDAALAQVGLTSREHQRFGAYSLGMKQRLAVAATLLKSPDLLILDEPTNGLDPAGIRDIRDMIRELGESGVTVLLSSHILAEVQQVCHSVSIIGSGRLLATGDVDKLTGTTAGSFRVDVSDLREAARILTRAGFGVRREEQSLTVQYVARGEDISRLLAERGLHVRELTPLRPDLEALFLRLTKDDALSMPVAGYTRGQDDPEDSDSQPEAPAEAGAR